MRIVIPGGSGQVGTILARAFHGHGHDVVVLSRRPDPRPWRVVGWDGETLGDWQREVDGCDVVINLTGRSVNCRYTAGNRQEILQSRLLSTRVVGQAIAQATRPPRVWLQASTATIYSHRYDSPNDEQSGILGGDELDGALPRTPARRSRGPLCPAPLLAGAPCAPTAIRRSQREQNSRNAPYSGPNAPDSWRLSIQAARAWERAFDSATA